MVGGERWRMEERKYIGVKEERLRERGEERVLLKRSTDPGERSDQQFK